MDNQVFSYSKTENGLTRAEIESAVLASLEGREIKKALLIPPDFTRLHSNAGLITRLYYHALIARGAAVDVLPALGTHAPMSDAQLDAMFGDIPKERFIIHRWREDVVRLGVVPAEFVSAVSDGAFSDEIPVEVNRAVVENGYDIILSIGQVVPHEVVGMANHAKNLFVGCGGSAMINATHMLGAAYGLERIMGEDKTPVRMVLDYALEHFLSEYPIVFALTVTDAPGGNIRTHGLFIGSKREGFERAVALSKEKNVFYVEKPIKKCVVRLDPDEFHSTWLGNKAVYRTRRAIADGGELLVLAPGIECFGEDRSNDRIIHKYGYAGRETIMRLYAECNELRQNAGAAAHLIHGSSDGRFTIHYCVGKISPEEIRSVGYYASEYSEREAAEYSAFGNGFHVLPNGEEFYYIDNPALGLWVYEGGI